MQMQSHKTEHFVKSSGFSGAVYCEQVLQRSRQLKWKQILPLSELQT